MTAKKEVHMELAGATAIGNGWSTTGAVFALAAIAVSLTALAVLHVLSPEYAWSWRMVSEYANGRYPWLLAIVFFSWAASSLAMIWALWPLSASTLGKVGLIFLFLAGIGQAMGGAVRLGD